MVPDESNNAKSSNSNIKTDAFKLADGFIAKVLLSDTQSAFFTDDWKSALANPNSLLTDYEKILKTEDNNHVAVKTIKIGNTNLKVVIKHQLTQPGTQSFFRSFRTARAIRNFNTALKLLENNILTARPLAALQQKKLFSTRKHIYITEYLEHGIDLYTFIVEKLPEIKVEKFNAKKQLSIQIAEAFAFLHKLGLWHRDAKASNFIVCRNTSNQYKLMLVDMDGIKPYFLNCRKQRFRCLWQLAASLISFKQITRTDYLRTFLIYCKLTGVKTLKQRSLYRKFARQARIKYLSKAKKLSRTN